MMAIADTWCRVNMYWRCRAALMQGHMARVFMRSREYPEGTPEHEAWLMGIDGVMAIRIDNDFKVQKVF